MRTHRCRCILSLSGRRGSNSRPSAWKADALSTELLPHCSVVGSDGFEPPKSKDSRFTVCPIWPLWKLPIAVKALQSYDYFIVFATLRPKKSWVFYTKIVNCHFGVLLLRFLVMHGVHYAFLKYFPTTGNRDITALRCSTR